MLVKVVSGGQTGVDRAALDAALERAFPCGGWCPRGRRAEDGAVPSRYPLAELQSTAYPARTARNVRDSDGTLIIARGAMDRGTALTRSMAARLQRPLLVVDLEATAADRAAALVVEWIRRHGVEILNVAGPRESSRPGIHDQALAVLRHVLAAFHDG